MRINPTLFGCGRRVSPLFEHLNAGQCQLLVVDAAGCSDSLDIQLTAPAPFEVDIGPDVFITAGGVYQLSATATAPVAKYQWQPANTAIILKATDTTGCTGADTLQLSYDNTIALYVPNAFTPNNDGLHDHLAVSTSPGILEIEYFRVFDRWGNLIFEYLAFPAAPLTDLWDGSYGGKRLAPDTFVWTASLRLTNRSTAVRSGALTLIF